MTAGESFPKEELGDILSNTTEYPADRICGGGLCDDSDPKDRAVGERRRRCINEGLLVEPENKVGAEGVLMIVER